MGSRNRHYRYENKVPFEIPRSWEWCSIGEICETCLGKMLDKQKNQGSNQFYLRNVNVRWGTFDLSDLLQMPFKEDEDERYSIQYGDLVVCEGGEPGRCAIWNNQDPIKFQKALHRVRCFNGIVNQYIKNTIEAFSNNKMLDDYYTGSTIKHLTGDALNTILIPLPPTLEQQRIVVEIEKWYTLVERLETNKLELQKVIKQAKRKVLDFAIHGELVPQDPSDEPAIELLKRINPNFVPCDTSHYPNLPFEIPDNWVWVKLGDISDYGKCQNVSVEKIGQEEWVLELEDIEKDTAKIIQLKTKSDREVKGTRHRFTKGCVLYSKLRTYLNKVLVPEKDGFCTTEIIPINFAANIDSHFMCSVLRSQYFMDYTNQKGYGVKMPRLSTTDAKNGLIPLPPFAEQKRIVKVLEDVFVILYTIIEKL